MLEVSGVLVGLGAVEHDAQQVPVAANNFAGVHVPDALERTHRGQNVNICCSIGGNAFCLWWLAASMSCGGQKNHNERFKLCFARRKSSRCCFSGCFVFFWGGKRYYFSLPFYFNRDMKEIHLFLCQHGSEPSKRGAAARPHLHGHVEGRGGLLVVAGLEHGLGGIDQEDEAVPAREPGAPCGKRGGKRVPEGLPAAPPGAERGPGRRGASPGGSGPSSWPSPSSRSSSSSPCGWAR